MKNVTDNMTTATNDADIRRDNRRALPKYLLILLCSAVAGGAASFTISSTFHFGLDGTAEGAAAALAQALEVCAVWGIPVGGAVLLGAAWYLYFSARRRVKAWDGEDEDAAETAEQQLNWALLWGNVQMILSFFFLSASVPAPAKESLICLAAFIVSLALIALLQQRVVDLERRLNPEKQGSIYDLHFQKKWMGSCDEAEQRQMGQAAMRAFRTVNTVCPFIWCVLMMLDFVFHFGALPAFTVLLTWGVLNGSYMLEAIRLSRR